MVIIKGATRGASASLAPLVAPLIITIKIYLLLHKHKTILKINKIT